MMDKERLNKLLEKVINETRALKIPVSHSIEKNVIVNNRPKKRFGCCRKRADGFTIEISGFLLDAEGCGEKEIRGVLVHEILHTCPGCYEHGERWKYYASMMNSVYGYRIKRVNSFAEMGISEQEENAEDKQQIRYIIQCKKCGRQYPRQRFTCVMKKINAYRCQCGGKLEYFSVEEKNKRI